MLRLHLIAVRFRGENVPIQANVIRALHLIAVRLGIENVPTVFQI